MSEILAHVGDIGTVFTATIVDQDGVVVDISTASTKEFFFRKPDGTVLTKAGSFVTTGVDGQMKYALIVGDLDQAGGWTIQGHVVIGTNTWKTSWFTFRVEGNLA